MVPKIEKVQRFSPAHRAGVRAGETLQSIDGHPIRDVLDYKFYSYDPEIVLTIRGADGAERRVPIRKAEGQDPGLDFATYLMDKQRACANKCVFCFIDQLPKGLRSSLYFKDDDARMSFLLGNYISMTNLSEDDVERMIRMRISPVNISVHTTNPALREKMIGNPRAGESLKIMARFKEAGLAMNAQIVVCPDLNDGAELVRSLSDLFALAPEVHSVSVVPVGLTRFRQGLFPLRPVDEDDARRIIDAVERAGDEAQAKLGRRMFYASDELYLRAGRPLPPLEAYDELPQLENGVGMLRLLETEFRAALAMAEPEEGGPPCTVVTGKAAAPFLGALIDEAKIKCNNIQYNLIAVENRFFGSSVDVAGLLTGSDIQAGLRGKLVYDRVLLPECTLRHGEDVFLDDMRLSELEEALARKITLVPADGGRLLDLILGKD